MSASDPVHAKIRDLVQSSEVLLFMKGSRQFPQCGFSSQVVQILGRLGAPFTTVDVLKDPEIRNGIKEFSSWPTIPQLYVKGEFVGGCDIVKEMAADGSLQKLLGVPEPAPAPPLEKLPTLRLTDAAAQAIRDATEEGSNEVLRFEIGPQFQYDLSFGPRAATDIAVVASGITIVMDPSTAARADDTSVSFVEGPSGGFRITNPNEPSRVKQLAPAELKAMMDRGEALHLYDVRTAAERAIATIAAAKVFDERELDGLEKNAPIVFHCHHGGRSQAAAEQVLQRGFKNVFNLRGGIDAWSQSVDPTVPRY